MIWPKRFEHRELMSWVKIVFLKDTQTVHFVNEDGGSISESLLPLHVRDEIICKIDFPDDVEARTVTVSGSQVEAMVAEVNAAASAAMDAESAAATVLAYVALHVDLF